MTGGPEALQVRETAEPEAGPGQVRIRVRAAGLNFADVMAAQGLYPDAPKPPCVVGYEAAGVVDALGDGVPDHAVGQRVVALTHFGGHADVVCVPAGQVFQIPDEMSFEEAAALGGEGVDVVLDPLGGDGLLLPRARTGRYIRL